MTTTTNTPVTAAWTKVPHVEGFYWMRRESPRSEVVDIWKDEGEWFAYRLGSDAEVKAASLSSFEFLGPITPEDFERLGKLQAAASNAIALLELGQKATAIEQLREAPK